MHKFILRVYFIYIFFFFQPQLSQEFCGINTYEISIEKEDKGGTVYKIVKVNVKYLNL